MNSETASEARRRKRGPATIENGEAVYYIGVRLTPELHAALLARQRASGVEVSLSALVRSLLGEVLGVKRAKKNGRKR
jgi:hypothetical protein